MACSCSSCFASVSGFFQRVFQNLGTIVGKHAKFFIPICVFITAGLSAGMIKLTPESNLEILYTPVNSRAYQDREKYQATFPDATGEYYVGHALTSEDLFGEIIVSSPDHNVLSNKSILYVRDYVAEIKTFNVSRGNESYTYQDVCAKREGNCVVSGEFFISDSVIAAYMNGHITYPEWNNVDLSRILGEVNSTEGKLVSAKYLKISFHLRQDISEMKEKSKNWAGEFLNFVRTLNTSQMTLRYAASHSLDEELDKNTSGDIVFFSVTFTLMIFYATVVVGGDVVSSRTWASWAGVLAAGFGILSAFGLVSLCGVKFVNIVGVMPFLIIGIGVDDMFLLMSSWAETYKSKDQTISQRMGMTFKSAGIGITITSLTDSLAFAIGATSVFVSVRNFCIFTGAAVIFSYLYQVFFFGSCLALHGYRVEAGRHCITYLKVKSREQLREEGKSTCTVICCGGSKPTRRGEDERIIEAIPRKYLPKILLNVYGCIIVIILFMGYLGVSIWGTLNFKQGLELKNLVSTSSYYYEYTGADNYFDLSLPIAFVFGSSTNYTNDETVRNFESLIHDVELDKDIKNTSLTCWFHAYRATPLYDNTTQERFVAGLKTFLLSAPLFQNDIAFDSTNATITASRCYLFSKDIKDSNSQADLMVRMRGIADSSSLSVYFFHPAFIYFEQYIAILPNTLQTVGIALAIMTFVTFIFLPHPLLVLLVVINIVSILVGIFGFLHIWGLTLSSVTMIHLIMSVGFSVDFSVHVCSAYMLSTGKTRREKAEEAITHAAGPILNGGMSSFLGIIVLVFSKSYIFNSFFKIMFTVILFGMLHAVFLLPVILRVLGPISRDYNQPSKPSHVNGISHITHSKPILLNPNENCIGNAYRLHDKYSAGRSLRRDQVYEHRGYFSAPFSNFPENRNWRNNFGYVPDTSWTRSSEISAYRPPSPPIDYE